MELYTKSKEIDWNRIVELYVDDENAISPYINDDSTYKVVILQMGTLHIKDGEHIRYVFAPALILLSNKEKIEIVNQDKVQTIILYFNPTVIHDDFTNDKLFSDYFKKMEGKTIYQDYILIQPFLPREAGILKKIYTISTQALITIQNIIEHMKQELIQQKDGFWPCRSRSYMMELLFFITYSCVENQKMQTEHAYVDPIIGEIMQYLHEHITDEISLNDLTKYFSMNRNRLNELFIGQTSMTCLSYLLQSRMELARIMLAETELPVGEVGARVGYPDTNYFTKVFKKQVGLTPSEYRKSVNTK